MLRQLFSRALQWRRLATAALGAPAPDEELGNVLREQAPVIWLLGKVQAGKTSIVHAITGDPAAVIGNAFQPCTRASRIYDFPPALPVVRFLDTRGLEEIDYDPTDDLALFEPHAHAIVAVARALDPAQDALLAILRTLRQRHPDWPVVLAQTRLHEGYADGGDHPPYTELLQTPALANLRRALQLQAESFQALPGRGAVTAVPIDLTRPEDGFTDSNYGLTALLNALDAAGSEARGGMMRQLARASSQRQLARIHPQIIAYATAAGVSDLAPVAGLFAVPTVQGRLLYLIARHYGQAWTRQSLRQFFACLGAGTMLGIGAGFGARQLGKLIPLYGQWLGSAAAGSASAAITYALGRAACHYFQHRATGVLDPTAVAAEYRGALQSAYGQFRLVGQSRSDSSPT